MITSIARVITGVNIFIAKVAAWAIIPLFGLLMSAVVMRYLVEAPAIWTSELAQMIFGVYAVIGGGYLLTQRGHVNVDIFYGQFSRRGKAIADVATSFLFFLFVLALLNEAISLAMESYEKGETTYSTWNPPIWPVKMALPIAAILLLLQGVVRLIADIRVLMGLPVDEAAYGVQAQDEGH